MDQSIISEKDPLSKFRLYEPDLSQVPGPISEVLAKYSSVPAESQIFHILTVRNSAYKVHPYPCLGRFRFLELDLSTHPLYKSDVLTLLTASSNDSSNEPLFLDFGTCLGQDIRKLIVDGVPLSRLYGSDKNAGFIDDGYALFKDEDKFPRSHMLAPADAFYDSPSNPLNILQDRVTVLHIAAVFHLFHLDQQALLAHRCLQLLNKTPGQKRLILGSQTANVDAGNFPRRDGSMRWRHNEQSWKEMWEKVIAHPQWKDKVKSLQVESILKGREDQLLERFSPDERQKQIGAFEEGFRWHIFWVWVEFQ